MKYKKKFFALLSLTLISALLFANINVMGQDSAEINDVNDVVEDFTEESITSIERDDNTGGIRICPVTGNLEEIISEETIPAGEDLSDIVEIEPSSLLPMEPNRLYLPPHPVRVPAGHSITDSSVIVQMSEGGDDSVRRATFVTDNMLTGFNNTEVGRQQVTVTLWGLTGVFYVDVFEITSNHNLLAGQGHAILVDGSIEDAGMGVLLREGNTPILQKNVTSDMVEGLDTSTAGLKEFTVTFLDLEVEASLYVIDADELPEDAIIVDGSTFVSAWQSPVVPRGSRLESVGALMYIVAPDQIGLNYIVASFILTDEIVTGYNRNRVGWQNLTIDYHGLTGNSRVGVFDTRNIVIQAEPVTVEGEVQLALGVTYEGGTRLSEVAPIFIIYEDGDEVARGVFEWTGATTGISVATLSDTFTGTEEEAEEWCFASTLEDLTWRVVLPTGVSARESTSGSVELTEPEDEDAAWFTVNLRLVSVERVANPEPDVQITTTASVANVNIDGNVVLTMTVRNAGTATATGVVVTSTLPSQWTYVSSSANATFNTTNRMLTESIGNMEPNATVTITATVRATTAGTVETTGTVSGTNIPTRSASVTVTIRAADGTQAPATGDNLSLAGLIVMMTGSLLLLGVLFILEKKRRIKEEIQLKNQITSQITR
jgi:uncharacterized repeat protein (TIGR01451 family)